MKIGLIVVGNEILSGKRQDKHVPEVIRLLGSRGLSLDWVTVIGDDLDAIAQILAQTRHDDTLVLSCGGIGATPDDVTRQAAAKAWGLPIERHADAVAEIVAEYGDLAYPKRVLMADFPSGAGLIPNPVNRVAGFFVGHQHFVPGFPSMAWPMIEWVLDQRYPQLRDDDPPVELQLRVLGSAAESELLDIMEATLSMHPDIALSSLPFRGDESRPRHIELAVKARRPQALSAFKDLVAALEREPGVEFEMIKTPEML